MFYVPEQGVGPYVIADLKIPTIFVAMHFEICNHMYPKRDEVTGEWRKPHNEKLNDLYSSPNIVWVIKSKRMRWMGHVACMEGKERCRQGFGGEIGGKETTWKTQA